MAGNTYSGQSDAAVMKPRLVQGKDVMPRDNSGGPDFKKMSGDFGDGGKVQGPKPHLTPGR